MARKKKTPKPATQKAPDFKNQPLSGLARVKERLAETAGQVPLATGKELTPTQEPEGDETNLFKQAMADVQPMNERSRRISHPASEPKMPVPLEREEEIEVMQALRDIVDGQTGFSVHVTDEAIEGATDDLDPRLLRKLRKGEFAVQNHLDLHGLTRDEARAIVDRFLFDAAQRGLRCVLIVHGRGHRSKDKIPVLKNALKSWFTQRATRKLILAFTTARPCDGGAGAVYVLLKKKRPVV